MKWHNNVIDRVYNGFCDTFNAQKEKIKIAVLDTGIELSEYQSDIYERQRDFIYKSWIDKDSEAGEKWGDDVGHGTHIATLLARVAPNAIIHVARVFRNREPDLNTEPKYISQVSKYPTPKISIATDTCRLSDMR